MNQDPTIPSANNSSNKESDKRTIITAVFLVLFYPVGFVLMWFWSKWKIWVKLIVSCLTLPVLIVFVGILLTSILAAVNPKVQIEKANCTKTCSEQGVTDENLDQCVLDCLYREDDSTKPEAVTQE